MIQVPCADLKHSFGQLDSGEWIEEYYIDLPPDGSAVLFSQPIKPNQPSQTPVAQVGAEKGLCVPDEAVVEVAAAPPVAPPPTEPEVGLGSFFLLVLVCIGGVKLFTYLREREAKEVAGYLPPIRGAEVWQQLPHEREKLPREQWVDNAIGRRAISMLEAREQEEAHSQGYPLPQTPENPLNSVSSALELRLNSLLNRLESALNSSELIGNSSESMANSEGSLGEFDVNSGATREVVQRFAQWVREGVNPRGNEIIEKLWGLKPGGSAVYKQARDLRDQLANRFEEFRGNDEN
ncbi:MAG: hypothetical protein AAF921_02645 [Cyanobacteria bacterium P01_D01_bin.44]